MNKILDFLQRGLLFIWKIIRVIWILFILVFIVTGSYLNIVEKLLIAFQVVLLIAIEIVIFGFKRRCPHCKKWFATKKTGTQLVDSENISILTRTKVRNIEGKVTGTQEQYIPGKRNVYRKIYICKKCEKASFQLYSKDVRNI